VDEVCLTINGDRHYLWRAVDQDGNVLDILTFQLGKCKARSFSRFLTLAG
jgi:putative transposase